jgi:2-dehydrotetronate isomerase
MDSMLRWSANISMLFAELPFLDRFAAARAQGFDAVEFWFPYEWPAAQVAQRLADNGLICVGINSPAGDVAAGDWGLAADPKRKTAFEDSVRLAFDYAAALNCPAVHVMAGLTGHTAPDPRLHGGYLDNIAFAAEHAAGLGKTVLIEPLNPVNRPGYVLWRQQQARDVIDQLALANVRVMFDLYHAQMTEGNLIDNLRAHGPRIGHIQVADVPGRHEPGTGEVNWRAVFAAIEKLDYRGWIGCEYQPRANTVEGLGWRQQLTG